VEENFVYLLYLDLSNKNYEATFLSRFAE